MDSRFKPSAAEKYYNKDSNLRHTSGSSSESSGQSVSPSHAHRFGIHLPVRHRNSASVQFLSAKENHAEFYCSVHQLFKMCVTPCHIAINIMYIFRVRNRFYSPACKAQSFHKGKRPLLTLIPKQNPLLKQYPMAKLAPTRVTIPPVWHCGTNIKLH